MKISENGPPAIDTAPPAGLTQDYYYYCYNWLPARHTWQEHACAARCLARPLSLLLFLTLLKPTTLERLFLIFLVTLLFILIFKKMTCFHIPCFGISSIGLFFSLAVLPCLCFTSGCLWFVFLSHLNCFFKLCVLVPFEYILISYLIF